MEALALFAAWLSCLLALVVVLLFGQNPALSHTPLPRLHWALTHGPCAGARTLVARVGGRHGGALLDAVGDCCFERSNPAVQLLFLAIFAACYLTFYLTIFPMLPLPGLPAWHKYTGTAAAAACLAAFLAACLSDPGAVTPSNLVAHQALYPYDGLLYPAPKDCHTCLRVRPARSKHCNACGKCVARADHHCIWLNSCVGYANMRWFLAFLLATATVCFYAAVVGYLAVVREMEVQGAWAQTFRNTHTDQLVYLTDSWRYLYRYLSALYGPQCAVTFIAGMAGWIVAGFSGYQLWLVCAGLTTNEMHKRRELCVAHALQAEAAEVEARAERALTGTGGSSGVLAAESGQAPPHSGQPARPARPRLPNHYDRGVWRNLDEVLRPHHHLRLAAGVGVGGKKAA